MGKLQLYLKGVLYQVTEIDLPGDEQLSDDPDRNFELNCQLRTDLVEAEATKFKLQYLRQIIKSQYEYEIYLVAESKNEEVYLM